MKNLLIIALAAIIGFAAAEARPKKRVATVSSFTPYYYQMDGFYATRTSEDYAFITSDYADGVAAPLPFYIFKGDMSDAEFRLTMGAIVDNLAEAFYD